MKDISSTSLRADAEEFWPIAIGHPRDLFRHASDTTFHAHEASTWPERVREDRPPQVQIHSQKTLLRLDAVPFTPGNGVLTPTQSNMAVLWGQPQPGTPMTPYHPTPMHYQAVPMSPGWQMMVPASPHWAGYWSPLQPHVHAGMQYQHWGGPRLHPNMPPQASPPEHIMYTQPQWQQPSPGPSMPRTPNVHTPPRNGSPMKAGRYPSPGSSPMGHHSANCKPRGTASGPGRPLPVSASGNCEFVSALRHNCALLSEAVELSAEAEGAEDSELQVMVRELESLMRLHEVQGPEPGKLARAFPVQRSLAEGHGYSKDLMPKAASSLPQTGVKPGSIKQVKAGVKDASAAHKPVSDRGHQHLLDDLDFAPKSNRIPFLNARSRRSLRRAVQRAASEAARLGIQLSAQLEELPQLNSGQQAGPL